MRWFESSSPPLRGLAQLVEHLTFNQRVEGSSPSWLTILMKYAGVAELADALDLGSSAFGGGSTPFTRTFNKITYTCLAEVVQW